MDIIRRWFNQYLSDPQVVILALLLVSGFAVVITMGNILAPLLVAIVLAYLLEGMVASLQDKGLHRLWAVVVVFLLFMLFLVFLLLGIIPRLTSQVSQLVQQLPAMISHAQELLLDLPRRYPGYVSESQVTTLMEAIRIEIANSGQRVLSMFLPSVLNLIEILVYVVLVPVLVFFLLKDKDGIIRWFVGYLPKERGLANWVWQDVDKQIANYVRGKIWEIFIVGAISYATFALMGLQYAVLLGTLVGVSVIIPYIGAAVVTLPIAVIGYFQWGWNADFAWLMIAYGVIQVLDGNVLVPLLFSEAVDLHPVAIIMAVLVFGGIWGFLGVFFAIPLASLVQAVLKGWPRSKPQPDDPDVNEQDVVSASE